MGKDFNFNHESTRLTPYAGAGYRQLFGNCTANKPLDVTAYNVAALLEWML